MDRTELGERLCNWHSSMHDPIYAVGSFYVSGQVYPDPEIVGDCLSNLTKDLEQYRCMLKGEKVMVRRNGVEVDLKVFAGYTLAQIEDNIADLEEIISELETMKEEDYS